MSEMRWKEASTVKISNLPPTGAVSAYGEVAKRNQVSRTSFQSVDKAEFSDSARVFSTALRALKQIPDVRSAKVEEIAAQIAGGTYQTDSRAVADKMLGSLTLGK